VTDNKQNSCGPAGSRASKDQCVLDAARQLFIEHGFGATSMDAIATTANVSKATLYAYYPGKQALFAATAQRECNRIMAQMELTEDLSELPLAEALERIARSFVQPVFSPDIVALLRMVISEVSRFPELGPIYYDSGPGLMHSHVADYMHRARERGLITTDDCKLAAAQFLGMLRSDRHLQRLLGKHVDTTSLEVTIAEAVKTFMARYAV